MFLEGFEIKADISIRTEWSSITSSRTWNGLNKKGILKNITTFSPLKHIEYGVGTETFISLCPGKPAIFKKKLQFSIS